MTARRPQVLIHGGLAPGGVQTHVSLLAELVQKAGAEVTVAAVANTWPPAVVAGLRAAGVRFLIAGGGGFGRAAVVGKVNAVLTWPWRLRRHFDLMYCHGQGRFHVWMRRFVRRGGLAVYHEIVDCPGPAAGGPWLLHRMDALIANSGPVADGLAALAPNLPVRTIPFLVSASDHPPPPPRPPVGGRELRVAYLGRLVRHKGIDWLVEEWDAIVQAAGAGPARLDVYGGDYEYEPLFDYLKERAGGHVRLHGPYPTAAVSDILAGTDLVLLPSWYEGLPLVLVEAMLQGVPFVAMAAGGTADLANPDVEVTPVGDRPGFVAAVGRLAGRLRAGDVDAGRLHAWADARYGRRVVADAWRRALLTPREFFGR